MLLLRLLPAFTLLVAGCLGAPAADTLDAAGNGTNANATVPASALSLGAEPLHNASDVYVRVLEFDGTLRASVGGPDYGPICVQGCHNGEVSLFEPDADVTALVAELRWASEFDLDLDVSPESAGFWMDGDGVHQPERGRHVNANGQHGAPDSPAVIRVDDPAEFAEPETWLATVSAKVGQGVAYELRISLFYGGPAPAEYTALADA